jgi:8-oxo-dGTP diphosphatase
VKLQIWDCGVIDPDSIRLIEHDEIRWLSVDELLDVKWLPADLPIIERWKREGIPRT